MSSNQLIWTSVFQSPKICIPYSRFPRSDLNQYVTILSINQEVICSLKCFHLQINNIWFWFPIPTFFLYIPLNVLYWLVCQLFSRYRRRKHMHFSCQPPSLLHSPSAGQGGQCGGGHSGGQLRGLRSWASPVPEQNEKWHLPLHRSVPSPQRGAGSQRERHCAI